jgi:hypothetical protein
MPKLTIYVDEDTQRRLKQAAKRESLSASKWVRLRLARVLKSAWPQGYFELFGSLANEKFERSRQGDLGNDAARESL